MRDRSGRLSLLQWGVAVSPYPRETSSSKESSRYPEAVSFLRPCQDSRPAALAAHFLTERGLSSAGSVETEPTVSHPPSPGGYHHEAATTKAFLRTASGTAMVYLCVSQSHLPRWLSSASWFAMSSRVEIVHSSMNVSRSRSSASLSAYSSFVLHLSPLIVIMMPLKPSCPCMTS